MRRHSKRIWFGAAFLLTCLGLMAQEREVIPGLTYQHHLSSDPPLSIHILTMDTKRVEVLPVRALNNGIGREVVSSIAKRTGATAAVNAGFFVMGGRYDGDPTGALKIRGEWYSDAPLPRGAVGWSTEGQKVMIGRILAKWFLVAGEERIELDGINRSRREGELILFRPVFHRSTLTDPDGTEVMVRSGSIVEIRKGGDSRIPEDGEILSIGPGVKSDRLGWLKEGASVQFEAAILSPDGTPLPEWGGLDHIVGGTPVLIRGNTVIDDFSGERVSPTFLSNRHPRTALGILNDGRWLLAIIDGRQPDFSVGMTMQELTEFLQTKGCVAALNLDGGGSTTLFLEGSVANSPSGLDGERPVSDALVLRPRP